LAEAVGSRPEAADRSSASSDQDHPPPVKPPRTPEDQGFRIIVTAGISGFLSAKYGYETRITMPDGQQLRYTGTQSAPGGTMSGGVEITPPGTFRRFTFGVNLNGGGLQSWSRPVVPSDAAAPFSLQNLQVAILSRSLSATGWRPGFSPYLEHELGHLLGNRLRLGYQYWNQSGRYKGSFFPVPGSRTLAGYDIQLNYSSHLVRLTMHNFTNLDDSDINLPGSHRSKRRYGVVQEVGILGGTHETFMIFIAVGPFWSF
jgi:hypothetical protein